MDYNYNSSREKLIMKEYGRNIQYLVQHAMTIQDPVERNNLVQDIIELMGTLNPAPSKCRRLSPQVVGPYFRHL